MTSLVSSFRANRRRSVCQLLAALMTFPAFYCVVQFLVAEPRGQIVAKGHQLPESWSAGVMSFGEYSRWWTISDRPVFFVAACVMLFVSLSYLIVSGLLTSATAAAGSGQR